MAHGGHGANHRTPPRSMREYRTLYHSFVHGYSSLCLPCSSIYTQPSAPKLITRLFLPSPHRKQLAAHGEASARRCSARSLSAQGHTMAAASLACAFFFDAEPPREPGMPAQDACALCAKQLARDSDVFMYRGDTPFCSEDCRHEQMRLDARQASARRQKQFSSGTEAGRLNRESRDVPVAS